MEQRNDWVRRYLYATDFTTAPRIFRKWTALSILSTSLQRKIYCQLHGRPLYPNLYVILVGPPGVGKGRAITEARERLSKLNNLRVSPAMLSPQKFFHNIGESTKADGLDLVASYAVLIDELSTFIPATFKDPTLINLLTDFFDCPKIRSYETLSRAAAQAENIYLTMLCGTTPKSLSEIFGKSTSGLGFVSRTNFIYSEQSSRLDIFSADKNHDWKLLDGSLSSIASLRGEISFVPLAGQAVQDWLDSGMEPRITEPRLEEYNARRAMHFIKLCMLYAVARKSLEVDLSDVEEAKETLLEAEKDMLNAFSYMGANPVLEAINHTAAWLQSEFTARQSPIPEAAIKRRLLQEIAPQYIKSTLQELIEAGFAKKQGTGYVPSKAP